MACLYNTEVKSIHPDSMILFNKQRNESSTVRADFVIKAIGFEANMQMFHQLGAELIDNHHPVFNEKTMETSVPGAYVLGTVVAGTQRGFRLFIENTHIHVGKILKALVAQLGLDPALPDAIDWDKRSYKPRAAPEE